MNLLQFRLDWIKKFVNAATRKMSGAIPEVYKRKKVTKMTEEIFQQMLLDAAHQQSDFYQDRNFPRLLNTARKILNFTSETDNHYEGQLAQFYVIVMLKMTRVYEAWHDNQVSSSYIDFEPNFEDFVKWFSGTALKSLKKISEKL